MSSQWWRNSALLWNHRSSQPRSRHDIGGIGTGVSWNSRRASSAPALRKGYLCLLPAAPILLPVAPILLERTWAKLAKMPTDDEDVLVTDLHASSLFQTCMNHSKVMLCFKFVFALNLFLKRSSLAPPQRIHDTTQRGKKAVHKNGASHSLRYHSKERSPFLI